jgi:hypothetical protein
MRNVIRITAAVILTGMFLPFFFGHARQAKAAANTVCGQWNVISPVNPNTNGNDTLLGVTAVAANKVWAMGSYSKNNVGHNIFLH